MATDEEPMITTGCPFCAECRFHDVPAKTPSHLFLKQLYCRSAGYAACDIAKRILNGENVREGVGPNGKVLL